MSVPNSKHEKKSPCQVKVYKKCSPCPLKGIQNSAAKGLNEAIMEMEWMVPDVHNIFPQVEQLVHLLSCPATSYKAEHSFSALWHLKTLLRNSMTQARLNNIAVCHIHKTLLDQVHIASITEVFATKSATLANIFESGTVIVWSS